MRPSKYRAVRTTVDGQRFDSKLEAQRWRELQLLEKAGEISGLTRQVPLPLEVSPSGFAGWHMPKAQRMLVATYIADFRYHVGYDIIYEDVKGVRTPVYNLKKKLVKAIYGIEIQEWPPRVTKARRRKAA